MGASWHALHNEIPLENEKYKSDFGQDKWVIEEIFKSMTNGFFVDVGAGNGIDHSNTYVLEKEYQFTSVNVLIGGILGWIEAIDNSLEIY